MRSKVCSDQKREKRAAFVGIRWIGKFGPGDGPVNGAGASENAGSSMVHVPSANASRKARRAAAAEMRPPHRRSRTGAVGGGAAAALREGRDVDVARGLRRLSQVAPDAVCRAPHPVPQEVQHWTTTAC